MDTKCLRCDYDTEGYICNCEFCKECCDNLHNDGSVSEYDLMDY